MSQGKTLVQIKRDQVTSFEKQVTEWWNSHKFFTDHEESGI